jgi:hypothetical protein
VLSADGTQPAYLLGHAWTGSRWWYFLGSVLVKVPILAVVVLLAGPFGWRKVPGPQRRKALAVVVAPAAVLYLTISGQGLDRGVRYAFPVVALGFVAAGPITMLGRESWRRVGGGVLALTQMAAVLASYPHSIAWTPPPFTPAYRWATDSNLDYGQDRELVEQWAAGRAPFVDLLLPRGFDDPAGSRSLLAVPASEVRGWVAVSATRLTALDRDALSWLRAYCPTGTLGGSVLLYRFDSPVDPRPGPTMPVGLCSGEESTRTG